MPAPGSPPLAPVALGMEGVIEALLFRLRRDLPAEMGVLEGAFGLEPGSLGALTPRLYANSERGRLEADEFPAILGTGDDTGTVAVHQIGPDGTLGFRFAYAIRLYGYVRGETFEEVSAARYRLALAVRQCLLRWPQVAPNARVEPERWREVFLGVSSNAAYRVTGGFYILAAVDADEAIATPVLGSASIVVPEVAGMAG